MRVNLIALLLAGIVGFLGGVLSNFVRMGGPLTQTTVRSQRFELVDSAGRTRAFWGVDAGGNRVIAFIGAGSSGGNSTSEKCPERVPFTGQGRNEAAGFGLRSDSSPFLNFSGSDGKSKMILYLGHQSRPVLVMSDENNEGRVLLGSIPHDSPSPRDDDWGLIFREPNLASIGVRRDPVSGLYSGTAAVRDAKGRVWQAP